ncbi:MAG TPA: ATP-dependent helicase, partial [Microbacterium sp.]|nr:ATP-dependent helicase [Microbacterium sp.]
MPKSKKPASGRPNFEPRYGEKKTPFHERTRSGGGQKPGSKSPSHRGYRAVEEGPSGAPKTRWTSTQRAGRDEARGIRTNSQGDRPARSYDDRPARSNDERPARREYGSDRPARSYGNDRPARPYSNDRPARSNDERPARREYGSDRPARSFDDRPKRDYNSDRPSRPYGNDRPQRSSDERPARRDYNG